MTHARLLSLPAVPPTMEDPHGHPRFGTWQGELAEIALHRLRGPWALPAPLRFLKRKRWMYAQAVTPEVVVALAVVHLGYGSNSFVTVLDRQTKRPLFDEGLLGIPGTTLEVNDRPGEGLVARFGRPGARVEMSRAPQSGHIQVRAHLKPFVRGAPLQLELELHTHGAPPALSVVSPVVGDGLVNATVKRAALGCSGSLKIGDRTWSLDGGVGGTDYTQGLLARRTAWRWAMGNGRLEDGTAFGFNLVEGFNETNPHCNENAVWVGEGLFPLPRARFRFDRSAPGVGTWELETADGSARLRFEPQHVHREVRNLRLVRSRFLQPLGTFTGTLKVGGRTVPVRDVGGVTEDQDVVW